MVTRFNRFELQRHDVPELSSSTDNQNGHKRNSDNTDLVGGNPVLKLLRNLRRHIDDIREAFNKYVVGT